MRVEPGLQDHRRGRAVDRSAPYSPAHAAVAQNPFGLDRGEALVVKDDGDLQETVERIREALGVVRALAAVTRHLQRVSHDDEHDVVLADELGDRLHVRRRARAHRSERDGETPFVVGDRDTDPRIAEIEAQDATAFC
jgi:hypothetical protein